MVNLSEIPSVEELESKKGRYIVDRLNDEQTKMAIKDMETGEEFPLGVAKYNAYKEQDIITEHDDNSLSCSKWENSSGLDF